ncbi:hypothetical protein CXB51_010699 [Gossypium anomalum]|uniref:Zinc knuckle CX2CX4HX4C domain-containing protein n=1 Tax=Gossypium anomalum TaxID=47600 RepID=A0A8J5Z988_9ROSI|nr:hypothetical protein CXB51_010699 [Gossypium anomalum]
MADELNNMLANLKFSETEQERGICQSSINSDIQGYEAWALGKFMWEEKINREAMYRVLKHYGILRNQLTSWQWQMACSWVRVKLDIPKPLRCVVYMVGADGEEILCAIKYEQLSTFCYLCDCIRHHTYKCGMYERTKRVESPKFQYGNWLRVQMGQLNQSIDMWGNGIETIKGGGWKKGENGRPESTVDEGNFVMM